MPATVVAEAGSHPTPSRPITALASAISRSLTLKTWPPVARTARNDFFQETGEPILMAVARVSGCSTGTSASLLRGAWAELFRSSLANKCASGAAPSACTMVNLGRRLMTPSSNNSRKPLPSAAQLPIFPPGTTPPTGVDPFLVNGADSYPSVVGYLDQRR